MKIEVTLSEEVLLTHQLFVVSRDKHITKQIKRGQLMFPIFILAACSVYIILGEYVLSAVFFSLALLWLIFYPIWVRRRYAKQYRNYIKEHYQNLMEEPISLQIEDDYLYSSRKDNEGKISTSEIEEITELSSLFLITLIGRVNSFIIPKASLADFAQVKTTLQDLSHHLNIKYNSRLDWKW